MKKLLFSSVVASLLMFSGCSQKNPAIDDTLVAEEVIVDSVNSQDNSQIDTNSMNIDSIISKLKDELGVVYFGFDQFNIRPDMQPVVSNGARLLSQKDISNLTIKLEGNCDEWGTDEYNMALGLKRAMSVKNALMSQGINSNRIQTISYGKNNPSCTDKTKSCWAKNRRVNFDLLP